MKKNLSLFLALCISILLIGCSTDNGDKVEDEEAIQSVETTEDTVSQLELEPTATPTPEPTATPTPEPEYDMFTEIAPGVTIDDIGNALTVLMIGVENDPLIDEITYKDFTGTNLYPACGYNLIDITHDGIPDVFTADGCTIYIYLDGQYVLFYHDWATHNFYSDGKGNYIYYDEWTDYDGTEQHILKGMFVYPNENPRVTGYFPAGCTKASEYVVETGWCYYYFKEDSRDASSYFSLEGKDDETLETYYGLLYDEIPAEPSPDDFIYTVDDLDNFEIIVPAMTDFSSEPLSVYAFTTVQDENNANLINYYKNGFIAGK